MLSERASNPNTNKQILNQTWFVLYIKLTANENN